MRDRAELCRKIDQPEEKLRSLGGIRPRWHEGSMVAKDQVR